MLYSKNGLVCTITHQKTYKWQYADTVTTVHIKNPFDECHASKYIVRSPHFQLERLKPNTEAVLQNPQRYPTPMNSDSHFNRNNGILAQMESFIKQEFANPSRREYSKMA
ncbi:Hypothetical predicted protein [Cloeon dipterum]|uniref:Uncharacterized protein n=1 Tax=Cloeon dipterum TaxID=197152 RepID=A0A8S1DDW7_9INSE|nr:Hypothetical predicted protein [Cloeon dipterum]